MAVLRICDIGLSSASSSAFHSMLSIVSSRAAAAWKLSALEKADVLLAHADSDSAVLSRWNASGKPMILVIDDRGNWPTAPFVLRHPFRVMQLLAILDDVAASTLRNNLPVREGRAGWATAESLRRIVNNPGERGWYIARCSDGSCVWLHDQQAYTAPATLARIRAGQLQPGVFQSTSEQPEDGSIAFATSDLAWSVGMQTPAELAPWLKPDTSYRLRRWPDFGRLEVSQELIELAADLAGSGQKPYGLARRSNRDASHVHRFLAATSLAGQLQQATVESATSAPAGRSFGWTRFVSDLCRHLRRVA